MVDQTDSVIANLQKQIMEIEAAVRGFAEKQPSQPPSFWSQFYQFTASGLFFMLVGSVFLIFAFFTMGPASAIFSFVLVVVGVAVLLFGTGTQSMGSLEEAKYKVSIAGGAGVLALLIAFGIIEYSSEMKRAFQTEKKYLLVKIEPKSDGISNFENYVSELSIDGEFIPVMRRGEFLLAYVPYFEADKVSDQRKLANHKKIHIRLHNIRPEQRNQTLLSTIATDFSIDISESNLLRKDAFFDFPLYCKNRPECFRIEISMQSTESAQSLLNRTNKSEGPPVPLAPVEGL